VSLYKYVIQRRLISACELLQQGGSVLSACVDSGFEDYTCFLKAFKKTFGLTPRQYLKVQAQHGDAYTSELLSNKFI
jgi:AraC-like DNA-binding protein